MVFIMVYTNGIIDIIYSGCIYHVLYRYLSSKILASEEEMRWVEMVSNCWRSYGLRKKKQKGCVTRTLEEKCMEIHLRI